MSIYHWQEYTENIERYRVGGYHPIRLDDEFSNGRYRIVHKLGYGTFSTVWLARDRVENRYVSLKILTALSTDNSSESTIRNHLGQGSLHHPGRGFILSLLDEFSIDGPNGKHKCIVSEIAGASVREEKECNEQDLLPVKVAREVTAQLALGLAYIHSCGVLHGDLHTHNIAFELPDINSWTLEQIFSHYGEPRTNEVHRRDDQPLGLEAPPYLVEPVFLWKPGDTVPARRIKILDYGEASFANKERKRLGTPLRLQPPESFFEESVGLPADMWAFACTAFEIFGRSDLFERWYRAERDTVLAEMVRTLGILPQRWWDKWDNRSKFCMSDGTPNHKPSKLLPQSVFPPGFKPLALRVQDIRLDDGREADGLPDQLSEDDSTGFLRLLSSLLRYEPSERATAEEVVKSDWIRQHIENFGTK
ncbi:hypothetical protein MMC13_000856 [Lambiella insularis]|nr:hypothetical protein [Lambiella insularis]